MLRATAPLLLASLAFAPAARAQAVAACEAAPALIEGQAMRGSTVGTLDRFHASCARSALSGDRVYRLSVPRRARVALRLVADYDAALYVRRACDEEPSEVACNDDAGDTRHAALDLDLDAGDWFVFVDGFDTEESGRFALTVSMTSLAPRVVVEGEATLGAARAPQGTRVEAMDRAGRVVATGAVSAAGRFALSVPGEQLVRVRARTGGVELSTEFFDPSQRRSVTLGGASVRRAPAGAVPNA